MTDQGTVKGGLDEPDELEPEQGSLALADAEDRSSGRTGRRPRPRCSARPDASGTATPTPTSGTGWRCARWTGSQSAPSALHSSSGSRDQRPPRPDRRLGHPGPPRRSDPKQANEAALVDLDNGVTSLWLQVRRPTPTSPPSLTASCSTSRRSSSTPRPAAVGAAGVPRGPRRRHPGRRHQPRRPRPTTLSRPAPHSPATPARSASSSTRPRSTTSAPPTGRSSASLAIGAAYLRTLTDAGFDIDEAARLIEFRYAATDEQFPTIAKLRAARRLWARVLELSGPPSAASASTPSPAAR